MKKKNPRNQNAIIEAKFQQMDFLIRQRLATLNIAKQSIFRRKHMEDRTSWDATKVYNWAQDGEKDTHCEGVRGETVADKFPKVTKIFLSKNKFIL